MARQLKSDDIRDTLRTLTLAGATQEDFEQALTWARKQLKASAARPVDQAANRGRQSKRRRPRA